MATLYPWLRAIHIVFMVTWFAGLFYLPRLFIYHMQTGDRESRERFSVMERRLFAIMTIGAVLTVLMGAAMVALNPGLTRAGWFMVKFALVIGLVIYHYRCWLWIRRLQSTTTIGDTRWLRWFNEIPVLFLLGIVLLAALKPF